jgi:homocysteine S-methyltransferase
MTDITLLDGGMGQELIARSGDAPTPLWATQVMMDHPGLVAEVHRAYFDAGSSVATTNSYAVHRDRLSKAGIEDRFGALHDQAVAEAEAARAAHGSGRIAGSIGPLGASYRSDVAPDHDASVTLYREVAERLAPRVDLILAETVANLDQARAVLEGAKGLGRPVWLSVTVDDEDGTRLRSGEPVAEVGALARAGGAGALLANCSAPEAMAAALRLFAETGLPYGAYANGFQQITKEFLKDNPTVDVLHARPEMTPERYADHAMEWVGMGATIIGGCCETGPAHIAAIARRLTGAGHRIV